MKNILWISPNFNHYKSRFLNSLAQDLRINLDVLSGAGRVGYGDLEINKKWSFQYKRLQVSKSKFVLSIPVYSHIKNVFSLNDWRLIPLEKKCFFLFIYLLLLRFFLNNSENKVKLISYCHPITKSKNGKFKLLNFLITKFFYKNLDRVIFYTETLINWQLKKNGLTPNVLIGLIIQ